MTKVDGAELCTCLAVLVLVLPALSAAQERDTTKPDSLKAVPPRIQTAPGLNTPSRLPLSSGEYRKGAPRFEVLLQIRGDYIGGEPGVATFFFRKVEVGIKGQVAEHVAFSVELDPVRPDDPFRRTYIRLSYSEHLLLKLGLEKAPVGLAELTSSDVIPFVSRPEVSDRFAPAEELGIHLEAPWKR